MRYRLFLLSRISFYCTERMMSTHKTLEFTVRDIQTIIPQLSFEHHKGQCGRIGVIGGSLEYTGAPYFAAITALRLGADLSHIFCAKAAGVAIKCYSPDLIVHPILDDMDSLEQIKIWLPRMHAVVIGPGLGRDSQTIAIAEKILKLLKELQKITVIDADGLFVVTQKPELLKDFPNSVITPNEIEFQRLCNATVADSCHDKEAEISAFFPKTTIVRKGKVDRIFNSAHVCLAEGGSARRCGGQGDILSGAIGLFLHWANLTKLENKELLACYAACTVTKMLNHATFEHSGRSMITNDMINKITDVISTLEKS